MKKLFKTLRPYLPIILIILLGAFLRLYRIADYMTFLGDEGRDSLVWLRMVREGKFTLIGPVTSIGNMHLGPLYYYLILPFSVIFGFNPVGSSVGVALFGLATIFLIYWVGKKWFGEVVGLTTAFLYAISPVVITFSRSSWNPNVMPFFALLTVWSIWQFWQNKKFLWLSIAGVSVSFAIQSHYLGLLLAPLVGLFWLITLKNIFKNKKLMKQFIIFSFGSLVLFFLLTIAPLLWFDLRHNFINYQAFRQFFTDRQTTVNFKLYKAIPSFWPLWEVMVTRLIAAKDIVLGVWIAAVLLIGTIFSVWRLGIIRTKAKKVLANKGLVLIIVWLLVGLWGMGLYKQHIYDHYFGFLFPALFLLTGVVLGELLKIKKVGKFLFLALVAFIVFLDFQNSPLRYPPNSQMRRVKEVDRKLIEETGGKPFNFGLIAKQNYEAGYAFFLELWGKKPSEIDPQRFSETITDQLFVVCEDPVCEPINNPKAEIANFGWSKVDKEWEIAGVKLFKLVHTN